MPHTLPAGFTLRPAIMSDLAPAVNMMNTAERAIFGADEYSLAETEQEWTSPDLNIATDTRVVVNAEGQIVGYVEVWDKQNPNHPRVWFRVHPDYETLGVGLSLLQWAEERAAQAITRCVPETRVSYRVGFKNDYAPNAATFARLNIQPARHFWHMRINRPDTWNDSPATPAGLTIRTMRYPDEFERTVLTADEGFHDHWGHVVSTPEQVIERAHHWVALQPYFDPSLFLVAVDNGTGEFAGVALSSVMRRNDPRLGWLNQLAVLRPWRKQGLGLALLEHTFTMFWRLGKDYVALAVDADSLTGATRLYERAGMWLERHITSFEKEIRAGIELEMG